MDKVGRFITEECMTGDPNVYANKKNLYAVYSKWCEANGVYAEQERRFGEKMIEKGYEDKVKKVAGKASRVWVGKALLG
jgi:phage/plasmid-associated DNA primase